MGTSFSTTAAATCISCAGAWLHSTIIAPSATTALTTRPPSSTEARTATAAGIISGSARPANKYTGAASAANTEITVAARSTSTTTTASTIAYWVKITAIVTLPWRSGEPSAGYARGQTRTTTTTSGLTVFVRVIMPAPTTAIR